MDNGYEMWLDDQKRLEEIRRAEAEYEEYLEVAAPETANTIFSPEGQVVGWGVDAAWAAALTLAFRWFADKGERR
jgi:hypothetical protein